MNEAETRAEHIDPALKAAGWGVVDESCIRRECKITLGRRAKALIADYVLEYRNTKLAVVEAKAWDQALTEGVAQAKPPIHANFGARQQAFLDFVLGHCVSDGVEELDQEKPAPLLALKYQGSLSDAVKDLAMPAEDISRCFREFQRYLYPTAGQ